MQSILLDDGYIRTKKNLYFNMLEYNPKITKKYFAETHLLKDISKINSVYILRPFGPNKTGGGKNIFIVKTTDELNIIKKQVNIDDYIASEYILNPLLFKNKKFHLRVPFIITYINNKVSFSIFKHITILQALLPYVNDDFTNKDIHDSHLKSTDNDYLFYNEFKNNKKYNSIISQIKLVITECVKMAEPSIKIHDETKNGYRTFVADFMITTDYLVKMLEINGISAGYKFLNIENHDIEIMFNKDYFGWIFQKTIMPVFFQNYYYLMKI